MIYAVQPIGGGPVKIGHSADVPARVRQLESHYGRPLVVLATMPGDRDEEQAIHRRFAHLRLGRTEQFRPAADLMAFLGRPLLATPHPEAVELLPGRPVKFSRGATIVLIADDLAASAQLICNHTGQSLGDYLIEAVQIGIEREFRQCWRVLAEQTAASSAAASRWPASRA